MRNSSSNISNVDKIYSLNILTNKGTKTINSIVSNSSKNDNYSWIELDCFFRPWAILFDSFISGYFDLFLFYISYHSSFVPDGQFEKYYFEDFYRNVLEEKFGLRIKRIEYSSAQEMHEKLKDEIDNNSRILVPIDLIGLSYNPMYKKMSHAHYMIVKGYDFQRNIYFTLDNMHIDGGASTLYKDFVIKFNELYYLNMLYFKNYSSAGKGRRYFWILDRTKNTCKSRLTISDVLLEHCEHFKNVNKHKTTIKYIEQDLLNEVDIGSYQMKYLIRRKNFKAVYYDILFKFLSKSGVKDEQLNRLKNQRIKLEEGWNLFIKKAMYKSAKKDKNFSDLQPLIENNIRKERTFRDIYIDITSKLKIEGLDVNQTILNLSNHFVKKNNNNAIIIEEDGKLQIVHSSKNKYDTWITEDNAPQLLIFLDSNENFSFETKVTVTNKVGYPFFSGIIVKFASGVKLMFGNNENRKVVVFCPEDQNYSLYERAYAANHIYLKVERNINKYTFYCKTDAKEEWEKQFIAEFSDRVENFGLISRTWEFIEHHAEFTEIKHSIL